MTNQEVEVLIEQKMLSVNQDLQAMFGPRFVGFVIGIAFADIGVAMFNATHCHDATRAIIDAMQQVAEEEPARQDAVN